MDTNEITEKLEEAKEWAIRKLFIQYVDSKIGRNCTPIDLYEFNPFAWRPDPDMVCELIWEYEPFLEALRNYCGEPCEEYTEQVKNRVLQQLHEARDLEQTNRVLAQTTKSI